MENKNYIQCDENDLRNIKNNIEKYNSPNSHKNRIIFLEKLIDYNIKFLNKKPEYLFVDYYKKYVNIAESTIRGYTTKINKYWEKQNFNYRIKTNRIEKYLNITPNGIIKSLRKIPTKDIVSIKIFDFNIDKDYHLVLNKEASLLLLNFDENIKVDIISNISNGLTKTFIINTFKKYKNIRVKYRHSLDFYISSLFFILIEKKKTNFLFYLEPDIVFMVSEYTTKGKYKKFYSLLSKRYENQFRRSILVSPEIFDVNFDCEIVSITKSITELYNEYRNCNYKEEDLKQAKEKISNAIHKLKSAFPQMNKDYKLLINTLNMIEILLLTINKETKEKYKHTNKLVQVFFHRRINKYIENLYITSVIESKFIINMDDIKVSEKKMLEKLVFYDVLQTFDEYRFNNKDLAIEAMNKIILDVKHHKFFFELFNKRKESNNENNMEIIKNTFLDSINK